MNFKGKKQTSKSGPASTSKHHSKQIAGDAVRAKSPDHAPHASIDLDSDNNAESAAISIPTVVDVAQIQGVRDRLATQSAVVMRLGLLLLSAGAGAYRVKSSMSRLARAVGLNEHHAQVTFTEITTSAYAQGTFRTEIVEQRALGVNAARIDDLRAFVDALEDNMLAEDAKKELDEIAGTKPLYGAFLNALASGVACAGFAFLNKCGLVECLCVLVAAFFGQALRRAMVHRHLNHFGTWMACGAAAGLIYISEVSFLQGVGAIGANHQAGFISAVLFLVPGFPLVTAILDLMRMDFSAGISRLSYVLLLLGSAGISVWAVSRALDWSLAEALPQAIGMEALLILRLVTSFVAAFGFAMLFNARPLVCLYAALIGSTVNTARLLLVDNEILPPQAAVGVAAFLIGLLAALISVLSHFRFSRVSLSVPAVVIMIPGVPLYRALAYLNNGNSALAMISIVQVVFVIFAIGVGLALSRMVTDSGWAIDKDTSQLPSLETTAR